MPSRAQRVSYLDDKHEWDNNDTIPWNMAVSGAQSLFRAQGFDGIDGGGAAGGEVAGQESGEYEAEGDGDVGEGIDWADLEEQRGHQAHQDDGGGQPEHDSDAR